EPEAVNAADERMKTAFAVAVVGLIVCPLVAQLISMLLVLATPGSLLTAVGRRRRRWALVVDVGGFAIIAVAAMLEKARGNKRRRDPFCFSRARTGRSPAK